VAAAAAAEVGLAEKLGAAAGELSGGQRRKLSVALAFVGDPAGEDDTSAAAPPLI
jgi:ATP-binding cassette subfamily A (ABC1) protein 1/ATP-binding cassette subfamily A (ABC1) protein 3